MRNAEHAPEGPILGEIGRRVEAGERLTAAEEKTLAEIICTGHRAQILLDEDEPYGDRQELEAQVEQGRAAHLAFARANYRLVQSLARRYPRVGVVDTDDMAQVGYMELLRVVPNYSPDRGTRFSTFVVPFLSTAMMNHVVQHGERGFQRSISHGRKLKRFDAIQQQLYQKYARKATDEEWREEVGEQPDLLQVARTRRSVIPLESQDSWRTPREGTQLLELTPYLKRDPIDDLADPMPDPAEQVVDALYHKEVHGKLVEESGLNVRSRVVLDMRYGLYRADGEPMTLEAIGLEFGVTSERIRQITRKAEAVLLRHAYSRGIRPFDSPTDKELDNWIIRQQQKRARVQHKAPVRDEAKEDLPAPQGTIDWRRLGRVPVAQLNKDEVLQLRILNRVYHIFRCVTTEGGNGYAAETATALAEAAEVWGKDLPIRLEELVRTQPNVPDPERFIDPDEYVVNQARQRFFAAIPAPADRLALLLHCEAFAKQYSAGWLADRLFVLAAMEPPEQANGADGL